MHHPQTRAVPLSYYSSLSSSTVSSPHLHYYRWNPRPLSVSAHEVRQTSLKTTKTQDQHHGPTLLLKTPQRLYGIHFLLACLQHVWQGLEAEAALLLHECVSQHSSFSRDVHTPCRLTFSTSLSVKCFPSFKTT